MRNALGIAVVVAAGCGAEISKNAEKPDAQIAVIRDAPDRDAAVVDPPIDAPGVCVPNGRVVYLAFDGLELLQAPISDARANLASWMTLPAAVVPPYRAEDPTRALVIEQIVAGVTAQLAEYAIPVVTARPEVGDYVMIAYGGTAAEVGSPFVDATQALDCDDATTRYDVAWVGDLLQPTQRTINVTIGAIGFGLGLSATLAPDDCMCGWDNECVPTGAIACTLGVDILKDPIANQICPGPVTQNEDLVFRAGFCS